MGTVRTELEKEARILSERHDKLLFDKLKNEINNKEKFMNKLCKNCKFFNRMLNYNDCDKGVACNVQIVGDSVIANVYEDFGCIEWKENVTKEDEEDD